MCGRFFVDAKNREIDRLLELLPKDEPIPRTGEVFPSNHAFVITGKDGMVAPRSLQWGFPRSDGKGLIINARTETALTKPLFARSLRSRPLAIPVSGFYEWKSVPGQKKKDKFLFRGPDELLWLAGFWNIFPENEARFTILTTEANASIQPWHDRMPVLLAPDHLDEWLSGKNLLPTLKEKPFELQTIPELANS